MHPLREYVRLLIEAEEQKSKLHPHKKGDVVKLDTSEPLAKSIEDDVFDMIKTSYAKIGGHAKISKPSDIAKEYDKEIVSDVDDDPEPDLVVLGSEKNGRLKVSASGTDGSQVAKDVTFNLKKRLFANGAYAEVSGAPAHILMNKLHVKAIEDEAQVRKILGKDITWHGKHPAGEFPGTNGWYTRNIGGTDHVKILVGNF